MTFREEARRLAPGLVTLRRDLHAAPEVGLEVPATQERILAELAPLGLEVTRGTALSSVVAVLRGGRDGPAVLLRSDMDALPVAEETGLDFAAANGAMHACGHDLHMAGLVGAARILAAHRDELPGSVVFMFQPGEEGAGGARLMIDEGVLDAAGPRVVAAYGIHVTRGTSGVFETRPGAVMSGATALEISVHGRGGHSSTPHSGVDPVPIAAEIVLALHAFVTRRFDAFDPVVLAVTMLEGGAAANIIPDSAGMKGTLRTLSAASDEVVDRELPRLVRGIAEAHGARAEVRLERGFPVTVNDEAEAAAALATMAEVVGADRVRTMPRPTMMSEDFSFVLRQAPGAFVLLGATPDGIDVATAETNHSSRVLFDDGVLGDQAAVLARLAWDRLQRG